MPVIVAFTHRWNERGSTRSEPLGRLQEHSKEFLIRRSGVRIPPGVPDLKGSRTRSSGALPFWALRAEILGGTHPVLTAPSEPPSRSGPEPGPQGPPREPPRPLAEPRREPPEGRGSPLEPGGSLPKSPEPGRSGLTSAPRSPAVVEPRGPQVAPAVRPLLDEPSSRSPCAPEAREPARGPRPEPGRLGRRRRGPKGAEPESRPRRSPAAGSPSPPPRHPGGDSPWESRFLSVGVTGSERRIFFWGANRTAGEAFRVVRLGAVATGWDSAER